MRETPETYSDLAVKQIKTRATCFDSTESSSGPRVLDPYKLQITLHV